MSQPGDRTVGLVRNLLAILLSAGLMAAVGLPVMGYEYDSGVAALAGTVALVVGLVAAAGITFALLDTLERIAARLVEMWR